MKRKGRLLAINARPFGRCISSVHPERISSSSNQRLSVSPGIFRDPQTCAAVATSSRSIGRTIQGRFGMYRRT